MELKFCGDLILREVCVPVADIAGLRCELDGMLAIMNAEQGVGLAAPQVGILQRFFIMQNPDTKELWVVINPKILELDAETKIMEEGCLSVQDDAGPVYADVSRPRSIIAEWLDETGASRNKKLDGLAARIFQHEYDHLDGKLFIDYLSSVKREQIMRKTKKKK
ncbi:MAG: peptide deformylase [Rickettsiales bacterium]|jgi:peptide deformylase|nr:peptide deformylase [Rickettsiales bacterium]